MPEACDAHRAGEGTTREPRLCTFDGVAALDQRACAEWCRRLSWRNTRVAGASWAGDATVTRPESWRGTILVSPELFGPETGEREGRRPLGRRDGRARWLAERARPAGPIKGGAAVRSPRAKRSLQVLSNALFTHRTFRSGARSVARRSLDGVARQLAPGPCARAGPSVNRRGMTSQTGFSPAQPCRGEHRGT